MPKRKSRRGCRTTSTSSLDSVELEPVPTTELASNPTNERLASVVDVGGCDSMVVDGCHSDEPAVKKPRSAEETESNDVVNGGVAEESVEDEGDGGGNGPVLEIVDESKDSDASEAESDAEESDDYDEYMDADEIDALLDQGMADYKKAESGPRAPIEKEKVVLIEKVSNPFEVLPDGWVLVSHNSGMPVYLHKESRVCTLSKPYFLGSGSARKHAIPVSAIPCLEYKKAVEKEKEEQEDKKEVETVDNGEKADDEKPALNCRTPAVEVKSAVDHEKENNLEPEELRKYCESVFQFKTIKFKRFNTWKERRIEMKKEKKKARPSLPSSTTFITCPLPSGSADKTNRKKEFVLNPDGKTPVCLLHEYVQRVLRLQPKYSYKDTDVALTPYGATITIDGIEYGTGFAANKKQAKQEAAKKALSVLIPDVKEFGDQKEMDLDDLSFFEEIKIEDPRVKDLCARVGHNGPFTILLECLKRNYGLGNTDIKIEMNTLKNQKCEYTMTAGKHTTTVTCKNKRDGKQQAAQALLQLLHPHLNNWGSIMKLYGKSTVRMEQEKKDVETQSELSELSSVICQDFGLQVDTTLTLVPRTTADGTTQAGPPGGSDVSVQVGGAKMSDTFVQAHVSPRLTKSRVFRQIVPPVPPPSRKDACVQCFRMLQDRTTQVTDDAYFLGDCWCVSREVKVHRVTQTEWLGVKSFHKATQEPEQTNLIKTARGSNYTTISHLGMEDKVTETDWTGSSMFHKATQFPDVTYSSEDTSKEVTKTTTRPSSPTWGQRPPQFSAPQFQMRSQAPPIRYQMPPIQMMQAPMYANPYSIAQPLYHNYQYYPHNMYIPQSQTSQLPPTEGSPPEGGVGQ